MYIRTAINVVEMTSGQRGPCLADTQRGDVFQADDGDWYMRLGGAKPIFLELKSGWVRPYDFFTVTREMPGIRVARKVTIEIILD
jgi:hypothetical protein